MITTTTATATATTTTTTTTITAVAVTPSTSTFNFQSIDQSINQSICFRPQGSISVENKAHRKTT